MPETTNDADPLSDVLRSIRLRGGLFFDVEASAPWAAEAPDAETVERVALCGAEHVIDFHAVVRGEAYGRMADDDAVRLSAGDVIVFPRGDGHVMSSAPDVSAPGPVDLAPFAVHRAPVRLRTGGDGDPETILVCGFIGCDARPFEPLLDCLPRMFVARGGATGGHRIALLSQLALDASRGPAAGSACVLERLSELMFIEAVRGYLATQPAARTGWLAGLRDPQIGAVLARIHEQPGASWSLELLARAARMSRTTFVERFTGLVGVPPMQYVTQWRIQTAATHLTRGDLGLAAIAAMVGFESESAFSRAFKRVVGRPPGEFRRSTSARREGVGPSP